MAAAEGDVPAALKSALDGLADGTAIDWEALDAAADQDTREMFAALRAIERIAGAHRRLPAATGPVPPFSWGPLLVRQHLARGAHGDVYRAWDPRLDREVALKLLPPASHDDATAVTVTEGSLLARVRHPNVVAVYGADRIEGEAGIWMELVDGRTLQQRVQDEGPLPIAEVVAIGSAVCAGLGAVHAAGLIHRDVKAQNVMQDTAGRTLLMDFGAGIDERDGPEHLAGTPLYLAPELFESAAATVASDLYAVGVLLFLLLTGEYPVSGATFAELQATHRRRARAAMRRPAVPRRLAAAIARALHHDPARRFESAEAMRRALDAARPQRRAAGRWLPWAATLTAGVATGVALLVWPDRIASEAPSPAGATVALPPHAASAPSTDGRFIPFIDSDGNVFRWDVRTRTSTPVVRADVADGKASSVLLAHDGGAAAYAWDRVDGMQELRLSGIDAPWSQVVLPPQRDYRAVPLDWSRDDRHVLVSLAHRDGTGSVAVVPATGGPPQVLLAVAAGASVTGSLAPDGSFAAVSISGTPEEGLTILPLPEGRPHRVLGGHTRFPQVLADRRVFFLRQHEGQETGWVLALDHRLHAGGAPTRVTGALGGTWQTRVTDQGVYLIRPRVSSEIYTVDMDASFTVPLGPPVRIDPGASGNHVSPAWSPDGRSLAYFTIRERTPGLTPSRRLTIRDMASGASRQVPVALAFLGGYTPRWSPDGGSLTVWGRDGTGDQTWGYFRVDVTDGAARLLVRLGVNATAWAQYSPDGATFLYAHPTRGIVAREIDTGTEQVRVPARPDCRPGNFALDPTGTRLAFTCVAGPAVAATTSLMVQEGGAPARLQEQMSAPAWLGVQAWTPDGAAVIVMRGSGSQRPGTLWKVSPEAPGVDGRQVRLPEGPTGVAVSPTGRRLAYVEHLRFPELTVLPLDTP